VSESSFTARLLRINAAWRNRAPDNSATGSERRARVLPDWFNTRGAAEAGIALADQLKPLDSAVAGEHGKPKSRPRESGTALQSLLQRGASEVRDRGLNFYQRAAFANSFKWRLLENGLDAEAAEQTTHALVLQFSLRQAAPALPAVPPASPTNRPDSRRAKYLHALAQQYFARAAYADAVSCYETLIATGPARADTLNNLGAALCKLGRYQDAEASFRRAIGKKPQYPDAHGNLGALFLWQGRFDEAEHSLRRALKSAPHNVHHRSNLGSTLIYAGRLGDARAQFDRVLRSAPRHAAALTGLGLVDRLEGRFAEAGAMFERALEVEPDMPEAWAALAGLRRMNPGDADWHARAEQIAGSGIAPLAEAGLRFAIGKYCDDVGEFGRAFKSYRRANELQKAIAEDYAPGARTRLVDDIIGAYTQQAIANCRAGASDSMKPVFVVGMMRSGTSLAEQIIASHPAVAAAGELRFWNDVARGEEALIRQQPPAESVRGKLAQEYLGLLQRRGVGAQRVVDKAPVNCDYLGLIHSVFPNARIIAMCRDPIDTCLSCYFQQFSPTMNFTMDLNDLAHYYREQQRLMAHWRSVLPPGTILEVPYAGLVADQEHWSRRMLEFLDLPWDPRCLEFHRTERPVVTASYWQVRQKMYGDSLQRWRNYRKFIAPLLKLRELDPAA
jgi:tetratricopeptide (TPR) repeat protein